MGEHLLVAVLRRHRGRNPEPERVEVAVERVGLAPVPDRRSSGRPPRRKSGRSASGLPSPVGSTSRGSTHRQILDRHRHHAALLAMHNRDRRAPVALARDREVVGAVARRRPRLRARRPSRRRAASPAARGIRAAIASSASSTAGMPSAAVGPKRASTSGETKIGSCRPRRARDRGAGVDHRHGSGVASAALPATRAQLVELLGDRGVGCPALDLRVTRREQHEAGLGRRRSACGVKTSSEVAVRLAQGRARPHRFDRGCSAGSSARARPSSASRSRLRSFSSR